MQKKEQYKQGEYGFRSITKIVDNFCAQSFNNDRRYYRNLLLMAVTIWNRIKWQDLRVSKKKMIYVDQSSFTFPFPIDYSRYVGVFLVDDCNNLQPLPENGRYNITPEPETKKCACKKCNCDSGICDYRQKISEIEEEVELNGATYTKITKTRVCDNGEVLEEITEPFVRQVGDNAIVEVVTRRRIIETIEVKACGCIVNTPANIERYAGYCGVSKYCCPTYPYTNPVQDRYKPSYKIDEERGVVHVIGCNAKKVVFDYVSTGDDRAELIMIPEYAEECMFAGMYWASMRFRSNISAVEKNQANINFKAEKQELIEFLYPINAKEFIDLQNMFPQW